MLTYHYSTRFGDNDGNKYMVSAINMFKTGIIPAWEDPQNQHGSEFRIELKAHNPEKVQIAWEKLVQDMVTGNMPMVSEIVTGVRLVQRQKNFMFNNYRIELWMTSEDEQSKQVIAIRDYLEDKLVAETLDQSGSVTVKLDLREGYKKDLKQ